VPQPYSHEFRENILGIARDREHNVTNRADRERLGCSQDDVEAMVGVLQSIAGLGLAESESRSMRLVLRQLCAKRRQTRPRSRAESR